MEELTRIIKLAQNACQSEVDTKAYEPFFLDVLNFLKSHENASSEFEGYFLNLLEDKKEDYSEVILYCMRELQWPKIKSLGEQKLESASDYREIRALERVLEVYEADWEDEDLWSYYSKG